MVQNVVCFSKEKPFWFARVPTHRFHKDKLVNDLRQNIQSNFKNI